MFRKTLFLLSLTAGGLQTASAGMADYYDIENISGPPGVDFQVGGMTFLPDGRLAACFHRGEVCFYDPETKAWTRFAEGLHEPLGIVAVDNNTVVVMQRPELTRIEDTDGDGKADLYVTLCDDFGMTGNYHEFAFGPVMDPEGNFVVSLNTASNGASVREEVRGEWKDIGLARSDFYRPWNEVKGKAGRMYSRVPWRGWVIKVSPQGKLIPVASGFRSPNGLGYDLEGRLYVTDNQGDWLGTSKCFHVETGNFYGHPASLVWREDWRRDPLKLSVSELENLRTRASFLFPQGILANSPTQPICDTTEGRFGPFAGQMFVGEMNDPKILRLLPDVVNGQMQGGIVPFFLGSGLSRGVNRMAFAPDGSLWTGHTHLSWAGGNGIHRLKWNGQEPFDIHAVKATPGGLYIRFTGKIDPRIARDKDAYTAKAYYFKYHQRYGSPRQDENPVTVTNVELLRDGATVRLGLGSLKAGYVYEIRFNGLKSADGTELVNPALFYNMVNVPR